ELKSLEKKIWKLAGEEFDIASPKQLGRMLFEVLKLSPKGIRKTSTKSFSTQFSELVKLRDLHPMIDPLIRYREVAKLSSTYISVLPRLVHPRDRRIHTTFHQTGTATGRLSSSDPNLQNIPIRTELGREIRRTFVAAAGYELVSFDYSQLELRIAAAFSGDVKMLAAFRKGDDIHARTAAEIFNVNAQGVTPEMRRRAKTINFGILYGMGARALAAGLGVSYEEAEGYQREYLRDFPGIEEYRRRVIADGRKNGYVGTLFGRKRYLPNLNSRFTFIAGEAERMAMNAPIQGTEADLIKRAMIQISRMGKKDNVRMLLQVHDELLFEIKKDAASDAARAIKRIMEEVPELDVPIVVDVKRGPNWQDTKADVTI
ncbi:MAG: DNA polymerase I, partial [Candidatus Ryanbacteria bacterium]|nr:DNA polymerase I [Candidatus Ryanbacteria bacterium]